MKDGGRPVSARWRLRQAPPDLADRWKRAGLWDDRTLPELIWSGVADAPDQTVTVHSRVNPARTTYAGLGQEARRVAAGLAARGVGPGDVVACQLPNWREAVATIWGAVLLGAVAVPIVHFYGRREVDYILDHAGVRAFVTTPRFGRLDLLGDPAARPALRGVETLVLVDPGGGGPLPVGAARFDDLTDVAPLPAPAVVDPDAPALVGFTSGTTSAPKGVVHTHRTLGAELRQVEELVPGVTSRLVGSPVGHMGGLISGVLLPVVHRARITLIDVWDAGRVLDLLVAEDLSAGGGATYFLTSLLEHPGITRAHLDRMRHTTLGGSAIPVAVARRATELGLSITRNFGATEHPTITGSRHHDPVEQRITTDGRPLPGVEIRIVDDCGQDVAPGRPGEILSRGPDLFVGYTDPDLTDRVLDADGWYHTEDIGVLDDQGFLTVSGRIKDIIIRGGENISAAEVEDVLLGVPEVAEVAVVGVPDAVYGEVACAHVRLRDPAGRLELADLREAARQAGLGRQKWPEHLRLVRDFPRTPSGKIKKHELRESFDNA